MESSCVRQTALPHTTKIFADFIYHPDRVSSFYPYLPLESGSFGKTAQQIAFSDQRRRSLVEALQVQNAGNPLLDQLASPGTVAVVTGQQVGLFSGPLYTIYKALTAIQLAARLTREGIPAVPIFWLATEDHDFAEVNQAWAFQNGCDAVKFEAGASARPNQPVGGVVLETVPLEELRSALAGLPFADEALDMVRQSYRPGATFGDAFGGLLERLLTGFPILRVDPMLPQFRSLAAPLLREAVLQAPALTDQILKRNKELTDAGYHAQVHVESSTALFFLLENGQRTGLRRQNGDYLAGKQKYSAAELADRADSLSPNALLRPVVQDSMIPTIAYVGGPAELAYLAQSEVLYRNLLGRQPIAVHRAGFTILDARAEKLLDRYGLELTDFFHGEEAVREKAARTVVNPQSVAHDRAGARYRCRCVGAHGRRLEKLRSFHHQGAGKKPAQDRISVQPHRAQSEPRGPGPRHTCDPRRIASVLFLIPPPQAPGTPVLERCFICALWSGPHAPPVRTRHPGVPRSSDPDALTLLGSGFMHVNQVKQALKGGRLQLGTGFWQLRSPEVARLLVAAGFNWAFVDTEHGGFDLETVQDLCRVSRLAGLSPIVRVGDLQYPLVARALDCGADGIIFPRVEDPELLARAVSWTKFPPAGIRGYGLSLHQLDYETHSFAEVIEHMNRNSMVVFQIETRRAFDAREELLSVPGVDAVMIGPADLSISLGVPGEFEHPLMVETIDAIIQSCRAHGVAPGIQTRNLKLAQFWRDRGMLFLGCSNELGMLWERASEIIRGLRPE